MSKTNIKMGQPSFIVKKDDGVIVCKIETKGNPDVFEHLDIYMLSRKLKKRFNIYNINDVLTFTVVTRHHKSDVWNEIIGKRIAEAKCKRQIYDFYHRVYKFILDEIKKSDIAQLERYVDNLGYCQIREDKHYKDLMG